MSPQELINYLHLKEKEKQNFKLFPEVKSI
jgi:hypothetical protein